MTVSSSAEENKALVRRYYEVFQEEDFEVLDEVLASDYTLHGIPGAEEELTGRDAVEEYLRDLLQAFPDLTSTFEELVAEDDTVAYRASMTGTHEGEFMGIPATGETVTIEGTGFFRIEDGKIAEAWPQMDTFGMMQQLGVADLPDS